MSDEAMSIALTLLAVASDPAATKKRLAELTKATADAQTAQAQLEAARIANERAFAETKADLDRRQRRITEDEVSVRLQREALNLRLASGLGARATDDLPIDPNFAPSTRHPNGMARGPA